jgi:hypothetical protein
VQPSQNQDLLRWSKAVMRLSTQKYIAMCAYIFFCICENVSVKLAVVINFIISLKFEYLTEGHLAAFNLK